MQTIVTARALLINPQGELLLVRRSQTDDRHPGTWDIPGGQVEAGESMEAALQRETTEEVGVTITQARLLFATSAPRPGGSGTWLFFAVVVPLAAHIQLGTEHDMYQWVPFADLPKYTTYNVLLDMWQYVTENHLLDGIHGATAENGV